ncbi:MAG: hypothetical protein WC358_05810 [Ignavibacteria bacterium]|jgi:hypothetical protein
MPNYFIFHCTPPTYTECIDKNLFGQGIKMGGFVSNVHRGDILFLVQVSKYRERFLNFIEGPFIALSDGTQNIIADAFGGGYPWQVSVDMSLSRNKIFYSDYKTFFENQNLKLHDELFPPFSLSQSVGNELLQILGIVLDTNSIHTVPTPISIESDFRKKYKANFLCTDGHYVRSLSEMTIDNWLYHNEILHSYEKKLPLQEPLYSDFYLKKIDCYIEFWGMNDDPLYKERKKIKQKLYSENNFKLLELEFEHLTRLDDILPKKLNKYGLKLK